MTDSIANDIAIVGIGLRLPGAANAEAFWRNLCEGVESITRFRDAELRDSFDAETRAAPNFVKARPILENIEEFDAGFFGMHAREAELTDPQHRVLLECAWEALEDGGYDPARVRGVVGVYAGSSINTYFIRHVLQDRDTTDGFTSNYQVASYPILLGAGHDFTATRIAYKFDLRGPAVNVNSACSTSLLAVAQACQSLLLYQSDMALAGGASISLPQERGYLHIEGGMASSDGHCRSFDAEASGTVFGSGAGMVLLKRLEDALADGDNIYAVIRGCGVNNDGSGKAGFTAPSVDGQAACIELAHAVAGVDPRSIGYVECHGTATPLGDPIEIAGLTKAFRVGTEDTRFCRIGSAKSNIGHLDAAAGVAGLIKAALSLKHAAIPPSLHYARPNPQIDFDATPFFVNTQLTPWDSAGPRRAGVSAFGVGGTNVHVVLEEAPTPAAEEANGLDAQPQLLPLSARSAEALDAARINLARHLRAHPEQPIADIAFTLQTGRRGFDHRMAVVAATTAQAAEKLDNAESRLAGIKSAQAAPIVFMFPGQGSQYPDMGRGLYESQPVFRDAVDRCADRIGTLTGQNLRTLLYGDSAREEAAATLMATSAAQPAIFTIEYALAQLWLSWGIEPAAMIGHSVGEFVAATLAGVFSLDDALEAVTTRARLMDALPGGSMLAVRLPEAKLRPLIGSERLAIAAVNGPSLCVVSGDHQAVAQIEARLVRDNIVTRHLHTSHAFHSPMVDAVVTPLRETIQWMTLSAPKIPCISCVSGTWLDAGQATSADYWSRHAREPVRFADGIATVAADGKPALLEVGPGRSLSMLAQQITRGRDLLVTGSLPDSAREINDDETLLESLARLWFAGCVPDWQAVHGKKARRRVPLPTYPFQRSRHWIDPPAANRKAASENASIGTSPAAVSLFSPASPIVQDESVTITRSVADEHEASLRASVVAILEDLSGETPPIDRPDATFLEMGFDSLFLTQVSQRIQSKLKVKITFRQLLGDYATIPSLVKFLAANTTPPPPAARSAEAIATGAPIVAAAAVTAAPAPMAMTAAAAPAAGIESLFRDQLAAMSQLVSQQITAIQSMGVAGNVAPQATPALSMPVAVATVPVMAAPVATAPAVGAEPEAEFHRPSRFDIFKGGAKAATDSAWTPEQIDHIAALVERYAIKLAGSKKMSQDFRAVHADPRSAAGFRAEWKEMVFPIVCTRSKGSKIWDIDGNEYVDLVNGYGQTAFGHTPDFVAEAVKAQLDLGFAIGPQADLAGEVARLFSEFTGNERVTFCNTGSEAVMAAMRVARNVTGRMKVAIFNGAYHGQFDEVLVKGVQRPGAAPRSKPVANGIPDESVANMVVLDYGTPESLQWLRENADDLAAVIVETIQSRHPDLYPIEFLRELRAITEASGTAFVMDEVVTGFRVHPGGMQAVSGIRADMATYGKVVGGGMPVGILAGKARFMDGLDGGMWQYGDDSFPETGVTFFAGTFVRHPLVLAAVHSVLLHLREHGPKLQETLAERTAKLVDDLNAVFAYHGVRTRIERYSSWFYFSLHNEHALSTLFFYHLRERGIHIQDGFPCFLTTAHTDEDLQKIVTAFRESLEALQAVGILGQAPVDAPLAAAAVLEPLPPPIAIGPVSCLPLTEPQVEVWLAAQRGDELSCAFNESVTLRMTGELDRGALEEAMNRLIARHDALRASFSETGEEMNIAAPAPLVIGHHDFSRESGTAAFDALLHDDARTPFDLVTGPLIRAHLVKLPEQRHALVLTAHHIICDGWSINVLVSEFAEIYGALVRGETPALPVPLAFSQYARRQTVIKDAEAVKTEGYWLAQYAEAVAPLELPTDRARAAQRSYNGASFCRRIDARLHQAVKKAGAKHGSTLFSTLLAAFSSLAGRFAGTEEVVVAVPTAGQSLLEDQILVGHCVNFLPIRNRWDAQTTIAQHLVAVSKQVLDAFEHQSYTFGTLVSRLGQAQLLRREQNRLPLTEIQFNLERLADRIELPKLAIEVEPNAKAYVNFDLFLNVIESGDGLRLDCDYNTDLFDATTIGRMLDSYETLLASFAADSAQPLVRAGFIARDQLDRTLKSFNRTAADYPRTLCVQQLFEARAAANPQAIAAQFRDESMSYGALDRRANQIANLLLARTRGNGKPIGILVERSLDMLAALLAVMKTGCAYIPLDPSHPPARLRYILGEAAIGALITDDADSMRLVTEGTPILDLATDRAAITAAAPTRPVVSLNVENTAYLIYTSGSTGLPKGVEVSHRSVVNLLTAMAQEPGLGERDTLFAVTTISFDIAALELYLPLTVGGKVVIAETAEMADGFRLADHIRSSQASVMQATPATWRILLEAGFLPQPGFRMLCGGEALPRELANQLLATGTVELWNMYGPTETTIWSSCARILPGSAPITIGRPIANTQFYVLDKNDQPLPPGLPGQLHIGGDGVARGYYRRPELNADRFIADPFAAAGSAARLYRSGDLARWLPDGTIQHLGRMDHQTKLRGFRIELGEIEASLVEHGDVATAVVMLREDVPGSPRLAAYYVEKPGIERAPLTLRSALAEHLPEYMIPGAWLKLDAMPLTPNGKLDRAALPPPEALQVAAADYSAPLTPTEKTLARIWGEVLNLERVGTTDDLFVLGVDSIQLFQIAARATRENIRVTAKQLIQKRTIAALAAELADTGPDDSPGAPDQPSLPSLKQFQRKRRAGGS